MLSEPFEFSLYATKAFKEDDETKDSKARAYEHTGGGDTPSWGKEACVDCVPVPEHLWVSTITTSYRVKEAKAKRVRTDDLQLSLMFPPGIENLDALMGLASGIGMVIMAETVLEAEVSRGFTLDCGFASRTSEMPIFVFSSDHS